MSSPSSEQGAISKSLQDLLKYYIISQVDTGDKTLNSLLITLLTLILCLIFSLTWIDLKRHIFFCKRFNNSLIDLKNENNFKEYKKFIEKNLDNFNKINIQFGMDEFYLYLYRYSLETIGNFVDKKSYYINLKTKCLKKESSAMFSGTGKSKDSYFDFLYPNVYPLHIKGDKTIAISYNYLYYDDTELLLQFIDFIYEYGKKSETKKFIDTNVDIGIYKIVVNPKQNIEDNLIRIGDLYKNVTFDNIISRHKEKLMSYLDNFVSANKNTYKRIVNYNFGAIFHGIGGTGKTLLCKVIANYLNRNILIVDMRKIKTVDMFEKIFLNKEIIDKFVIILDEFDFVQGIIKDRNNNTASNMTSNTSTLDTLKDRQLKLLSIISANKNKEGGTDDIFLQELNMLNKKIEEEENILTLDTLLTLFDGIVEMRNRCIIATTNFIDRIDPCLIREGRFDLKLELAKYTNEEIKNFLKYFFEGDKGLEKIDNISFLDDVYTPAQVVNIVGTSKTLEECVKILSI